MKTLKIKTLIFIPSLLLSSCDGGYICKGRKNYKPANFVSFFEKKEVLTDRITYIYKTPGSEEPLVKDNRCAYFKLLDSNKIIGILDSYLCNYYIETGECTLTKGSSIVTMNLDSNLAVNDVALKCFDKLEITPTFSSNDVLLAVGDYFLEKEYWDFIPCLYYRSIALYVTDEELKENTVLQNNIKNLFDNNEEEYSAWEEMCHLEYGDKFSIIIGMNSDETKLEPQMFIGPFQLLFPKYSEKYAWSNKTGNQS